MNIPPVFQPFIAATKTAFAYLQNDYGFHLTVQQALGYEAWVIYENPTTRIAVHYELGTVPGVEIGRLELRDGEITQPASIDLERILRARGNPLDYDVRAPRDFGESEIVRMVSIRADRLRVSADDVLRGDFRAFPKLQASENRSMDTRLLGCWTNEAGEPGAVLIEFSRDGNLTYSIREDGRIQKILLTFSVSDGVIKTDQPSQPRVEETKYRITEDGRLELNYDGKITTYVRVNL